MEEETIIPQENDTGTDDAVEPTDTPSDGDDASEETDPGMVSQTPETPEQVTAEMWRLQVKRDALKTGISQLDRANNQALGTKEQLEKDIDALRKRKTAEIALTNEYETARVAKAQELSDITTQVADARDSFATVQRVTDEQKADALAYEAGKSAREQAERDRVTALIASETSDVQSNLDSLKAEVKVVTETKSSLTSDIETLTADVATLTSRKAGLESATGSAENTFAAISGEVENKRRESDAIDNTVTALTQERDSLTRGNRTKTAASVALDTEIVTKQTQSAQLDTDIAAKAEEKKAATAEVMGLAGQKLLLQQKEAYIRAQYAAAGLSYGD